jgi:phosphatidylethanolamine N-methyltransferase
MATDPDEFDDETLPSLNENSFRELSKHRKSFSAESITSVNGDITALQIQGSNKIASRPRTRSSSFLRTKAVSQHDLLNKYFKRDAVVLRNVDLLRYVPCIPMRNRSDCLLRILRMLTEQQMSCLSCS